MSDIKPGDHVRIIIEGRWTGDATTEGEQFDSHLVEYSNDETDKVFLEKIEPPVEVFKPGDRLRRKGFGNYEVTLADEGYLQHFETGAVGFYKYWGSPERELFNSERYERVALG